MWVQILDYYKLDGLDWNFEDGYYANDNTAWSLRMINHIGGFVPQNGGWNNRNALADFHKRLNDKMVEKNPST